MERSDSPRDSPSRPSPGTAPDPLEEHLARLGSLTDEVRRSLYRYVATSPRPVRRDEAAEATGISRSLAAYHLDRLVEEGLLDAGFETDRPGGPGAGRPAKLYRRSERETAVTLPPRDDELAGRILARAVEASAGERAAHREARRVGEDLGGAARREAGRRPAARRLREALWQVLDARGYEPHEEGDRLAMRNCPFDHLTEEHRDLVCGMNLALLEGLVGALGLDAADAVLDPRPGRCCVTLPRH